MILTLYLSVILFIYLHFWKLGMILLKEKEIANERAGASWEKVGDTFMTEIVWAEDNH